MTRFVTTLVLLTVMVATPAVARERFNAHELHEQARALFLAGKYKQAAVLFEQSYAKFKHPNTCQALGETYRRLRQYRESHRFYTEYAASLPANKRAAFQAKLERLRFEQPGKVVLSTTPSGASVRIDGTAHGLTPAQIALAGGKHEIVIEREGFEPLRRSLLIEFGETATLRLRLGPIAAKKQAGTKLVLHDNNDPPPTPSKPLWKRWWFWTGVAVVVAGATAVSIAAYSSSDETHMPQGPVFQFDSFKR